MGKPLNWVLSGISDRKAASGSLRSRLAATTILAVAPFLGYGRQAYAACVASPSPTFICSDMINGDIISVNNAEVSTAASPPFVVTTDGLYISGDGNIQFTDNNASTINNDHGPGLSVISTGDILEGEIGAVTIVTNGDTTGLTDGIYSVNHGSGDLTITTDGNVTGQTFDGIYAVNNGNNLIITAGAQSVITGDDNAIDARNYGSGDLTINAYGHFKSNEYDGIFARNGSPYFETSAQNLNITIGAKAVVDGADNGLQAQNYGTGDLEITVDGSVAGQGYDGIHAINQGNNLIIITGAGSLVKGNAPPPLEGYGDSNGIDARNYGAGYLKITADGEVFGNLNDAIYAKNYGTDLTVSTGVQSIVRGGGNGIGAYNFGSGNLSVTADGLVGGYSEDGDGIHALNSEDGQNVTITTGAASDVFGGKDGIDAHNFGSGFLNISVDGEVTGRTGDGIHAINVAGEYFDFDKQNLYFGNATDLKITTGPGSVVTGANDGIDALHAGTGVFEITVNGEATGLGEWQLFDYFGSGIEAFNAGDTTTVIKVGATGLVQGADAGIFARSYAGQPISITNNGLVRNLSAESDDLAITTYGGLTQIHNNGALVGVVTLDLNAHFDDVLDNDGIWNASNGFSDFGFGEDVLNNRGVLLAADDPTTLENTYLSRLEFLINDGGLISLVDGQAGDNLYVSGNAINQVSYVGDSNGRLAVDAELGPSGISDELHIDGTTTGTTLVHVHVVSATGANFDGIPVVVVDNGSTVEDNFNLDGPLSAGFFSWGLRLDGNTHELYTLGDEDNPAPGAGAFEFPAGFSAAQDIWLLTIGSLLNRQADLRSLLQGVGVTPVADFSEPVAPTPVARVTPGFWFQGLGGYVDRNQEESGFDLDHTQTIYGGLAGFDFGSQDGAEVWLFGLFGGYIGSNLEFKATNTKWDYEGPTAGAYVTYLNQAFYADVTVKADFLDIDIDPDDLAAGEDDSNTDAVNIGGRFDTGYKFGQTVYIEPQASLAVVDTEIDDVDIFGGTVAFEDETSVRGRVGLRLGFDHATEDATIVSGDVMASVWENFTGGTDVNITDPGGADFGVSGDQSDTYGDVSLGLSAAHPQGWSTFLRANYLFAEDYDAVTGNAGVRFVW